MLAMAPDSPASQFQLATYVNVAAQLAALGVEPLTGMEDARVREWIRGVSLLPMTAPGAEHALNEGWRATFGFDYVQIDQMLVVGEPPDQITLLRGRFDVAEIRAAWRANGYQAVDVNGVTVASLAEEREFDLKTDVGRLSLGALNNMVLLDDGTLVLAPTLAGLTSVLDVVAGKRPPLGERSGVARLIDAVDANLVAATIVTGNALRGPGIPEAVFDAGAGGLTDAARNELATRVANEGASDGSAMPPVAFALLGATAGGPLPSAPPSSDEPTATPAASDDVPMMRGVVALLLANAEAVATAIPVVERRLTEGVSMFSRVPYAELFPGSTVGVTADEAVLLVELGGAEIGPARRLWDAYYRRDLLFVAW